MFWLRITMLTLVLLAAVPVVAQDGVTTTYTSSDGTFTFQYPADWEMMDTQTGVMLDNLPWEERSTSPISFTVSVSPPGDISQFSMMGWGDKPAEIVRAQAQFMGFAGVALSASPEDFEDGELEGVEEALQMAEEVVITEYSINDYPAAPPFSVRKAYLATQQVYISS